MPDYFIVGLGLVAQTCFSARFLIQWLLSEKYRRVITPSSFWILSLIASILLFFYGYLRADFAIMLGQGMTYFIYIRNLHLQGIWNKTPLPLRGIILLFPVFLLWVSFNNNTYDLENIIFNSTISSPIMILGISAQLLFTFRFVYQWLSSEKKKNSYFPHGFWLISISGALLILIYAIYRKDIVLIIGHLFGIIVYLRNLMILRKRDDHNSRKKS